MTFWKKNKLENYHPGADRPRACRGLRLWRPEYAAVRKPRRSSRPSRLRQKHRSRTQRRQTRRITLRRSRQQTPAETTPEPSDDPQTDEPAQADTEQPEYVSPEEVQAGASGEYEEVGGMTDRHRHGQGQVPDRPRPGGQTHPRRAGGRGDRRRSIHLHALHLLRHHP